MPALPHARLVHVVPLHRCLVPLLVAFVPWLVIVLGRGVCLTAQRIPALVRLVRAARRWREDRRARGAVDATVVGTRPVGG